MSYDPVPGGKERVDRERQDADRRYHEVFAELDRLVNEAAASLPPGDAAAARLAAFQSVLVQFLQQITPYIDTKVRVLEQQVADIAMTAAAAQRTALSAQRAFESSSGLRPGGTEVARGESGVAQGFSPADMRGTSDVARGFSPATAGAPAPAASASSAALYLAFEDLFRGSESEIRARQSDYVPLFAGARDVLDVGCGRGEFLALLREAGIAARGLDLNEEMVAACRAQALQVERADASAYLASLPDESLGGLFAAQVVEHLEPVALAALLRDAARVLRPGARLVLETINPTCWVAFFESYLKDLTHARPLHPETLKYLVVANGFRDVEVRFRSPIPEDGRLRRLPAQPAPPPDAPPEVRLLAEIVQAFNLNMERLNDRMFTHLDYAVVGVRA